MWRGIEGPEGRARFLTEELPLRPGHVLGVRRGTTGRLGADLPARATGEVAMPAVPPALAGLVRGPAGAEPLSAGWQGRHRPRRCMRGTLTKHGVFVHSRERPAVLFCRAAPLA